MADDYADDMDDFGELLDEDEIEAYCMSCRQTTPVEDPEPIWTRRGAPGTRGTCPVCGTTVFRMGLTDAHRQLARPGADELAELARGGLRRKVQQRVTYLAYSVPDAEFAEILASELRRIGIDAWLPGPEADAVHWATRVHPALAAADAVLVVLTPLAAKATPVQDAIRYAVDARKRVFVALLAPAEVPDALRRRPRFDFTGDDFRQQFRLLAQALTEE